MSKKANAFKSHKRQLSPSLNYFKSREAARKDLYRRFFFDQYAIHNQYKFKNIYFINACKLGIRSLPDCGSESFPGAI